MSSATTRPARPALLPHLVLGLVLVAALVLRWQLVDVTTGDYRAFLQPWYDQLASGGFGALAGSFSNYNTPYLVLLWLLTHVPVAPMVAIKGLSVLFDLVLAGFGYGIVRQLRPGSRWAPVVAASVVLLLPTVVMNGSAWAQCDSIYAACCAASLYFLLRRRPWLACAAFGLAFAFKLQAVFFLPVLVVVLILNRRLLGRRSLLSLLAVPVTFLAALVPALVAGRSLASQLAIYPAQLSDTSGVPGAARPGGAGAGRGGGGAFGGGPGGGTSSSTLTRNAPTWYAWLPSDAGSVWKWVGLVLAAAVVVGFGSWLLRRHRPLTPGETVLLAATATLVVPLLLPQMHERYFYVAEVLLVAACFVDLRFLLPAAAIQLASVSTYLSYLGEGELMPLGLAAAIALLGAGSAVVLLIRSLSLSKGSGSGAVGA